MKQRFAAHIMDDAMCNFTFSEAAQTNLSLKRILHIQKKAAIRTELDSISFLEE